MKSHKILTKAQSARTANQPIPISGYKVVEGPLSFNLPLECVLKANPLIQIYSRNFDSSALITHVKINDNVKKGQVLLDLNADIEMFELKQAKKSVALLAKELEGYEQYMVWSRKNRKIGLGVEAEHRRRIIDWLHAKTTLGKERIKIELIQDKIKQKKVQAPVDGIVVDVMQPGQTLRGSNVPLATLAVVDPILMECPLNEDKLRFVGPKQHVDASFYSFPGKVYHSKISHVHPIADGENRTITLRIELANADATLKPGLHGIAHLKKQKIALRVPNIALLDAANVNEAYVFVVNVDQTVHLRKIETNIYANGYTEVVKGLEKGEQIVIAGQLDLQEGDLVRIVSTTMQGDKEDNGG